MSDLSSFGNTYKKDKLNDSDIPQDPMTLFENWLQAAFEADLPEPSAMTLATCNSEGRVSSRIVLLKGYDGCGFQFYANYNSKKGKDLKVNSHAALSFFWPELERQVRIEGVVRTSSAKESDLYHDARPRINQLGAWASDQSEVVKDRETLEARYMAVRKTYENQERIPRPSHWGGYKLSPLTIEFWQGREARLHDRIEYYREQGRWFTRRLNP